MIASWSSWMAECQPEIDNYIQNLSDKGMHDGKDTVRFLVQSNSSKI